MSDNDGRCSFGRYGAAVLLMSLIACAFVVKHVLSLTDSPALGVWLSNIPAILLSIAGVVTTLFGIQKAGDASPEVIRAIQKSKEQGNG